MNAVDFRGMAEVCRTLAECLDAAARAEAAS